MTTRDEAERIAKKLQFDLECNCDAGMFRCHKHTSLPITQKALEAAEARGREEERKMAPIKVEPISTGNITSSAYNTGLKRAAEIAEMFVPISGCALCSEKIAKAIETEIKE